MNVGLEYLRVVWTQVRLIVNHPRIVGGLVDAIESSTDYNLLSVLCMLIN